MPGHGALAPSTPAHVRRGFEENEVDGRRHVKREALLHVAWRHGGHGGVNVADVAVIL